MQRKPGFPVANCNIKVPDSIFLAESVLEEGEPLQRRQQLINFGHTQWGFNNWSWAVTKQDLDFVEMSNGKYSAGVVAFVSITVKTFDIHRENIGYATSLAPFKGAAIHNARKCAVTNALRETLLSFGGNVTTELLELLDAHKSESANHPPDVVQENNQNPMNKHTEPMNTPKANVRKELEGSGRTIPPAVKNAVSNLPIAKAHPMPVNLPPAANRAANAPRGPLAASSGPPVGSAGHPAPPPGLPAPPAPRSNEVKLEDMSEEEARAERRRRQRLAQEEFRLKQLMKQKDIDDNQEVNKNSSIDNLLMAIPTQDIVVEETGNTVYGKRKAPPDDGVAKRHSAHSNLEAVKTK